MYPRSLCVPLRADRSVVYIRYKLYVKRHIRFQLVICVSQGRQITGEYDASPWADQIPILNIICVQIKARVGATPQFSQPGLSQMRE